MPSENVSADREDILPPRYVSRGLSWQFKSLVRLLRQCLCQIGIYVNPISKIYVPRMICAKHYITHAHLDMHEQIS